MSAASDPPCCKLIQPYGRWQTTNKTGSLPGMTINKAPLRIFSKCFSLQFHGMTQQEPITLLAITLHAEMPICNAYSAESRAHLLTPTEMTQRRTSPTCHRVAKKVHRLEQAPLDLQGGREGALFLSSLQVVDLSLGPAWMMAWAAPKTSTAHKLESSLHDCCQSPIINATLNGPQSFVYKVFT